jgi:hypothetical protein
MQSKSNTPMTPPGIDVKGARRNPRNSQTATVIPRRMKKDRKNTELSPGELLTQVFSLASLSTTQLWHGKGRTSFHDATGCKPGKH